MVALKFEICRVYAANGQRSVQQTIIGSSFNVVSNTKSKKSPKSIREKDDPEAACKSEPMDWIQVEEIPLTIKKESNLPQRISPIGSCYVHAGRIDPLRRFDQKDTAIRNI